MKINLLFIIGLTLGLTLLVQPTGGEGGEIIKAPQLCSDNFIEDGRSGGKGDTTEVCSLGSCEWLVKCLFAGWQGTFRVSIINGKYIVRRGLNVYQKTFSLIERDGKLFCNGMPILGLDCVLEETSDGLILFIFSIALCFSSLVTFMSCVYFFPKGPKLRKPKKIPICC